MYKSEKIDITISYIYFLLQRTPGMSALGKAKGGFEKGEFCRGYRKM